MPTNVIDALGNLIGQTVAIAVDGRTLTGVLASVTAALVILATSGGVLYINPANIRAVGTTGGSGVAGGTAGL
ncbi:MAG TPA: hypothetical protein VGK74_03495 [Symbiobacteriaceae bacterium]|jgi:ferredoxin-fold anticodon binding domain-containing protein